MAKTDRFKKDHQNLMQLAMELSKHLNADVLAKDAAPVCKLLTKIGTELLMHTMSEDSNLYPLLLKSTDQKVRDTATTFQKEMGGIKTVVKGYFDKWSTPAAIQKDPKGFITATMGLLGSLKTRLDKENTVLFTLVEKMAA